MSIHASYPTSCTGEISFITFPEKAFSPSVATLRAVPPVFFFLTTVFAVRSAALFSPLSLPKVPPPPRPRSEDGRRPLLSLSFSPLFSFVKAHSLFFFLFFPDPLSLSLRMYVPDGNYPSSPPLFLFCCERDKVLFPSGPIFPSFVSTKPKTSPPPPPKIRC